MNADVTAGKVRCSCQACGTVEHVEVLLHPDSRGRTAALVYAVRVDKDHLDEFARAHHGPIQVG